MCRDISDLPKAIEILRSVNAYAKVLKVGERFFKFKYLCRLTFPPRAVLSCNPFKALGPKPDFLKTAFLLLTRQDRHYLHVWLVAVIL